jgi:hypothetical protein
MIVNIIRDAVKYYDKSLKNIPRSFALIQERADLDQYTANLDPIRDANLFYFSKWENLGSNLSKFNYSTPIVALREVDFTFYDLFETKEKLCRRFDMLVIDFLGRECSNYPLCNVRDKNKIHEDNLLILSNIASYISQCEVNITGEVHHKDYPNKGIIDEVQTNKFKKSLKASNKSNIGYYDNVPENRILTSIRLDFCADSCIVTSPTFVDKTKHNMHGCC